MKNSFYLKLAFENIKKNTQIYLPYLFTCIGTISVFYIISSLVSNPWLQSISPNLTFLMAFGLFVIGIFTYIFIFYTNSFLMKRRKKELGLYNILGMEKRHLARVMFYETMYIALISFIFGLIFGVILSKLAFLGVVKTLQLAETDHFNFAMFDVVLTLTVFTILFILVFFYNLKEVTFSNPIELLRGGDVGEKEPRSNWLVALIGALSLGSGYYIALTVKDSMSAMIFFFVAVTLVIVGTFLLFTSGSIVVLKILRRNRKYYYQTKHFISVSNMLYRMKRNAMGLATICILSTIVLVTISTTYSLYSGIDEFVNMVSSRDFSIGISTSRGEEEKSLDEIFQTAATIETEITTYLEKDNFTPTDILDYQQVNVMGEGYYLEIFDAPTSNQILSTTRELQKNQAQFYLSEKDENIDFLKQSIPDSVELLEPVYNTVEAQTSPNGLKLLVGDKETQQLIADAYRQNTLVYVDTLTKFDFNVTPEIPMLEKERIEDDIANIAINHETSFTSREAFKKAIISFYGGLFFLGIFLGTVFIFATVLTIYYKQVTEGYEDERNFEILQKVGIDKKDIKRTIQSQIQTVFFLPLVTAGIHVLFAYPMIMLIVKGLGLINEAIFLRTSLISFGIFTIFYIGVYLVTSRTYYKIVKL